MPRAQPEAQGHQRSPHTDPTGAGSTTRRLEDSDARPRTPLLKILQNFTWAMPFACPNHPARDAGVHRAARLQVNSEVIAFQPPPAALPGSRGTQANTVRKVRTRKETTLPPRPLPEKKKKVSNITHKSTTTEPLGKESSKTRALSIT